MSHPMLFVYGTLLTVAKHPMGALLRKHGTLVGHGSIRARLYIIDDPDAPGQNCYPGALPAADPSARVFGEVYAIHDPEKVFEAFDDYEACSPRWPEPHEFLRRPVDVTLDDGAVVRATTYFYTWDVSDAEPVASGRYTAVSPDTV